MYTFLLYSDLLTAIFQVFIKNQPVDSYLEHLIEEYDSYDIKKLRHPLLSVAE